MYYITYYAHLFQQTLLQNLMYTSMTCTPGPKTWFYLISTINCKISFAKQLFSFLGNIIKHWPSMHSLPSCYDNIAPTHPWRFHHHHRFCSIILFLTGLNIIICRLHQPNHRPKEVPYTNFAAAIPGLSHLESRMCETSVHCQLSTKTLYSAPIHFPQTLDTSKSPRLELAKPYAVASFLFSELCTNLCDHGPTQTGVSISPDTSKTFLGFQGLTYFVLEVDVPSLRWAYTTS